MPTAESVMSEKPLVRAFIYGPGKSRKTTWAMQAANAGFRVLFLSLERGEGVMRTQVAPDCWKNIYIVEAHDGPNDAFAATCIVTLMKNHIAYIDEVNRKCSLTPRPGHTEFNLKSLGQDTVLVIDTWTAFVASLTKQFSLENNIDLSQAAKQEWDGYGWMGRIATWVLVQLRTLPCNYVVVGHSTQYEKYKKDPVNPKKQGPLEWSRRQPISTSNPHGMSINDKFDHMLFSHVRGRTCYIDTRGSSEEDAGSRVLPPAEYPFDELTFAHLAHAMGIPLPGVREGTFQFSVVPQQAPLGAAVPQQGVPANPVIIPATAQPAVLPQRTSFLLNR